MNAKTNSNDLLTLKTQNCIELIELNYYIPKILKCNETKSHKARQSRKKSDCLVITILSCRLEGQWFKLRYHKLATVGPRSKVINTRLLKDNGSV